MAGRKMAEKKKENHGRGEQPAVGLFHSSKIGFDLVQNCDFPPPMRIFAGQEKTFVLGNGVYSAGKAAGGERDDGLGVDLLSSKDSSEDEKLELLKALRLSQTRAREAEKKTAVLSQEKNDLANFCLRQSMELFAYKQWVEMTEILVSMQEKGTKEKAEDDDDDGEDTCWIECKWLLAVAICVSIAGVGIFSFFSSH